VDEGVVIITATRLPQIRDQENRDKEYLFLEWKTGD